MNSDAAQNPPTDFPDLDELRRAWERVWDELHTCPCGRHKSARDRQCFDCSAGEAGC